MRNSSVSLSSLALVLIFFVGNVPHISPEETGVTEFSAEKGPFNCIQLMLKGAKSSMKSLTPCSKEIKSGSANAKDYADKLGCIMRCALRRIKLLNDNYNITEETVDTLVRQFAPSEFMVGEVKAKILNSCATEAAKLDPFDEYCKSYSDFVMCLQTSMEDFLNTSPYCLKRKKDGKAD